MIKSVVWALCVLAILGSAQLNAQNVTTWHYDINRTGRQQNETTLTATGTGHVSQSNFGLLWQWQVTGAVFAQPLAVTGVQTNNTNCQPCNLVFIATEKDMLYAFSSGSPQTPPVWSVNLAASVTGGTAVDCGNLLPGVHFGPCDPPKVLGSNIGHTGTPVIDTTTNTLYLVGAVQDSNQNIGYYIFAVDIRSGTVLNNLPTKIAGTVSGKAPSTPCHSTYPAQGQVSFDYDHIQRSALLLMPNGNIYVPFAPGGDTGETKNGWIFGYSFNGSTFSQSAVFTTTPYGTGGGIWQSAAGLASDGSYIYAVTGNGTNFDPGTGPPVDMGDTLLKLNPFNGSFTVTDYFTPSDVFSYPGSNGNGNGRCQNDVDFGSGGVLVFPDAFYFDQNNRDYPNLVVNADKESKLYVANRDNLGMFNPTGGNNIQTITTPPIPQNDPGQGYWASPAYWKYTNGSTTNYMLYYSATTEKKTVAPKAINGYQLLTTGSSGPIASQTPTVSSSTLFCSRSPTPTVSSQRHRGRNGHRVGNREWQFRQFRLKPGLRWNPVACGVARVRRNQSCGALQQQGCDHDD
ncbi:MAG TPA: hypothetical protein VN948_18035 [Terriglobales bacterium]|nr:hypothetical protein [Terriglobales bacterium]